MMQVSCIFITWLCTIRVSLGSLELKFVTGIGRHSIKAEDFTQIFPVYGAYVPALNFIQADATGDRGSGMVTTKGLLAATYFGHSFTDVYGSTLFPDICNGNVPITFYADNAYVRCKETAQFLIKGIQYNCSNTSTILHSITTASTGATTGPGSTYRILSEGQADNLYPGCTYASQAETNALYGSYAGNNALFNGPDEYLKRNLYYEIKTISDAIQFSKSNWCTTNQALCVTKTLLDVPTLWSGAYFKPWSYGWDISKAIVNMLYFQVTQGNKILNNTMSAADVLRVKKVQVEAIGSYLNDYNIRSFQQDLIIHILGVLEQAVTGVSLGYSELQSKVNDKLVLFLGHDANLLNILKWLKADAFPYGQPKNSPGYMHFILFELWKESTNGTYYIRPVYHAPTIIDLSNPTDPNIRPQATRWTNQRSIISIPGCTSGSQSMCPYTKFKKILLDNIMEQPKFQCMSTQMQSLVYQLYVHTNSPSSTPTSSPSTSHPSSTPTSLPTKKPHHHPHHHPKNKHHHHHHHHKNKI